MTDSAAISAPYRQAARRIRARLGHRPAAMMEALRDLAVAADRAAAAQHNQQPTKGDPRPFSASEAFSQLVLDHLEGPVLRFSVRQKLLRQAAEMGIGRFEANLLIALVEHRHRQSPPPWPSQPSHRTPWRTAAIVLLIEVILLTAAGAIYF